MKRRDFSSTTLPSRNLPTRILGPCKSHMIATVRDALRASSLTRAARGRDIADAPGDAELVDRRDGVAAAGDREGRRLRDGARDGMRAFGESIDLENADRSVPDDRAGGLQALGERRSSARADVENH